MESTLVLFKPDISTQRDTVLAIMQKLASYGLIFGRSRSTKELSIAERQTLFEQHYIEHRDQPWYPALIEFMIGGPTQAFELVGPDAVATLRSRLPELRAQYGTVNPRNAVHASDSLVSAQRELKLWF